MLSDGTAAVIGTQCGMRTPDWSDWSLGKAGGTPTKGVRRDDFSGPAIDRRENVSTKTLWLSCTGIALCAAAAVPNTRRSCSAARRGPLSTGDAGAFRV